MYKNDLIYMTTTTSSSVSENGQIPLTTITRRRGTTVNSTTSNTISLSKPGYYTVFGTITFTGQATGDATIEIYKNGTTIPGGVATTTVGTASTITYTMPINATVRVFCGETTANITLVNTGVAITTTNIALNVEYEG